MEWLTSLPQDYQQQANQLLINCRLHKKNHETACGFLQRVLNLSSDWGTKFKGIALEADDLHLPLANFDYVWDPQCSKTDS